MVKIRMVSPGYKVEIPPAVYSIRKKPQPFKNLHMDSDKDGVKNAFDCKPFDPKRQGIRHYLAKKVVKKVFGGKERENNGDVEYKNGLRAEVGKRVHRYVERKEVESEAYKEALHKARIRERGRAAQRKAERRYAPKYAPRKPKKRASFAEGMASFAESMQMRQVGAKESKKAPFYDPFGIGFGIGPPRPIAPMKRTKKKKKAKKVKVKTPKKLTILLQ